MKNFKILILFALVVLLFSSCAHTIDVQTCVEGTKIYGFWNGLWHGMISGLTFIGSLFNDDISVYAVNNNGGWYDFGFLWGVAAALGSSSTTYVKNNRRSRR